MKSVRIVSMPRWIGSAIKLSWLLTCLVVAILYSLTGSFKAFFVILVSSLIGMPPSSSRPTWLAGRRPKKVIDGQSWDS